MLRWVGEKQPVFGSTVRGRARGHLLPAACPALLVLAVAGFGLGVPLLAVRFRRVCTPTNCSDCQVLPTDASTLQAFGLSLAGYALYTTTLRGLSALVHISIAGLIIWRKPNDQVAVLVACMLALNVIAIVDDVLMERYPALRPPLSIGAFLATDFTIFFFYLFPDGRPVPRSTFFSSEVRRNTEPSGVRRAAAQRDRPSNNYRGYAPCRRGDVAAGSRFGVAS